MDAPRLREAQALLWTLITAPEGVEAGLRAHGIPRARLEALVRGDQEASAVERLDVYADMYFYRLLEALRTDYPALLAALGDDSFHDLCTDYLLAHPSTHPSLRHLGEHLPGFLETWDAVQPPRWLPELARLEWARVEVFDAADAEAVSRADLVRIAPEAWPQLRLRPVPACQRLSCAWPVHQAWARADAGEEPARLDARPTLLKVWRQDLVVYHAEISAAEDAALQAVVQGASWAEVCDVLAAGGDLEAATASALEILTGWLDDGLLASATVPR